MIMERRWIRLSMIKRTQPLSSPRLPAPGKISLFTCVSAVCWMGCVSVASEASDNGWWHVMGWETEVASWCDQHCLIPTQSLVTLTSNVTPSRPHSELMARTAKIQQEWILYQKQKRGMIDWSESPQTREFNGRMITFLFPRTLTIFYNLYICSSALLCSVSVCHIFWLTFCD